MAAPSWLSRRLCNLAHEKRLMYILGNSFIWSLNHYTYWALHELVHCVDFTHLFKLVIWHSILTFVFTLSITETSLSTFHHKVLMLVTGIISSHTVSLLSGSPYCLLYLDSIQRTFCSICRQQTGKSTAHYKLWSSYRGICPLLKLYH